MTADAGAAGPEPRRSEPVVARDAAGGGGVRVEYVKRRRVVRIRRWHDDGREADSLEVGVAELCERLDIDPAGLRAPSQYLVFGGSVATTVGGASDLVGAYLTEERAREAFDGLLAARTGHAWAEVVAVDLRGQVRRLAWFGLDQPRLARVPRPARSRLERLARRRVG